jgi:cold-inducible RNA-binding protein
MKLFVAGLTGNFDEVDLKEMFELYGDVKSALLVKDKNTGKSKGFGFVDMVNEHEAKEAIQLLNGVSINRKQIAVKIAEENPQRSSENRFNSNSRWNNDQSQGGFRSSGGYNSGNNGGYNSGNNNRYSQKPRFNDRFNNRDNNGGSSERY